MSWLRIAPTGPAHALRAYCVGDCKTLRYREGSGVAFREGVATERPQLIKDGGRN